jgi:hypothetical protein
VRIILPVPLIFCSDSMWHLEGIPGRSPFTINPTQ